jgi:hypothetical protein
MIPAMSSPILNLEDAPEDPIERLIWLGGVAEQVAAELAPQWQQAYFWARFSGRLDDALRLGLHSHKRVMAWTRAENEHRGRMIRWGDRRS